MRHLTIIVLFIFNIQLSHAQTHEIGVFVGGSNFIGDVGSTKYIAPNSPAFGGIYKWNRSPRHSFRFSLIYSELQSEDSKSDDPRRIQRNFSFNNHIIEGSLGLEFTFLDFDLHDEKSKLTPYLYPRNSLGNTNRHIHFFYHPCLSASARSDSIIYLPRYT